MFLYMAMIESEEERSKFEMIYEQYRCIMFSVAQKILHNDRDAEDAVQEAFLKIIKNLEKINVSECHKTKLYIVITVRRTAIDIYRKKKSQEKIVPLDELVLDEKYEDSVAQEEIENVKDKVDMANLINLLPDRYRDVILLKYYNEFSDKEIAHTLGTTEANVRKLLERAKKRLAREYEKGGTV